ncbi:MAG: hypothetical protein AAF291_16805 [Pseudomonadota bacterium]
MSVGVLASLNACSNSEQSADSLTLTSDEGKKVTLELPEEVAQDRRESAIARVVDRFDAPQCNQVNLLEGGRNPDKRRPGGFSVFFASGECVTEIKAAIAEMGWENTVRSEYRFKSEQGWAEYVTFDATEKPDITLVKWELPDS